MNFIIDKTMSERMIYKLSKYGNIYWSMEINSNDKAISTHPDLQIHFINSDTAVCAPETAAYYRDILPDFINIVCGDKNIGANYPEVSAYNIARVGRYIICNTKIADTKILEYYKNNGFTIIHVNQGYTKCNVCPLTENLFITEDRGIYNAVKCVRGIDVTILDKYIVKLNGFENGFIGGASGLADRKLFMCGKVSDDKIKNIAERYSIEIIELSDEPLYDYGSIIVF